MSLRIKAMVDKFVEELKEALDADIQDRIMKDREMQSYIQEREREVAEREVAWKTDLSCLQSSTKIIADDCFQHINVPIDRSSQVVIKATEKLYGKQVLKHINLEDYISSKVPSSKAYSQKSNGQLKSSSLKLLASIMQLLQRHEFGQMHDERMSIVKPELHPAVSAQLQENFEVSNVEIENSKSVRSELRVAVNSLSEL